MPAAQSSPSPPAPSQMHAPLQPAMTIDALILWLIEHPGEPKRNAAKFFGVREQFIYSVTQSDLFKAKLQDVLRERLGGASVLDIHAKLAGLMEMSIDKLTDALQGSSDPKFIFEVATRLIASARGPQVAVQVNNTQNNVSFQVDARVAAVAQARTRILEQARAEHAAKPPPSVGELLAPSPFDPEAPE